MKNISRWVTCFCLVMGLQHVNAATLEIDTIPGGAVDLSTSVLLGDFFTVNVIVESVVDLAGHDISIGFDDSILTAVSLTSGLFYGADDPLCDFSVVPGTCTLASDIGPGGSVSQADIATDIFGITGSGVLFSIEFEAIALGSSGITFDFAELSDSLGDAITPTGLFDGSVTVSAVPVPGAVWLFASGLIGLVGVGKSRRRA